MSRALLLLIAVAACRKIEPAPLGELSAEQRAQARNLVEQSCLMCHSIDMLEQQRLTPAQWAASVKKMQGWGAPLEPGEPELLAAYLSSRFHLDAGPWEPPAAEPPDIAATPDGPWAGGDARRGEAVYRGSCASCHGLDARGAAVGTNLVDRPVLYRAGDFDALVKKGRGRMPETPGIRQADIAALLAYLRTLRG